MFKKLQQITIEDQYSRKNVRSKVAKEVAIQEAISLAPMTDAVNDYLHNHEYYRSKQERVDHVKETVETEDIISELLIILLPLTGPQTIQSIATRLGNIFKFVDVFDAVKTASEIMAVCAIADDVFTLIAAKSSDTGSIMVESNYELDEHVMQYIADTKYLPPMICIPQRIKSNRDCGYLTLEESIILGSNNHHNLKQSIDTLNLVNSVKLSLDTYILDNFEETMHFKEPAKSYLAGVQRETNFTRLVISSKKVYQDLLEQGNEFYFTNKYDKRGRMYTQGYHVNIQSTEFKKSIINLHKQEVIEGVPA